MLSMVIRYLINLMKKILAIVALVAATISQTSAQSAVVLTHYYSIKDALVASNPTLAASNAGELKKSLGSLEQNGLSEASRNSLLKEVNQIAGSKDIKAQRAAFTDLSNAMMILAKTEKLSTQPVYKLYCPMKKSYWLSNEKVVKNPYYGASMLTCGKVEGTI